MLQGSVVLITIGMDEVVEVMKLVLRVLIGCWYRLLNVYRSILKSILDDCIIFVVELPGLFLMHLKLTFLHQFLKRVHQLFSDFWLPQVNDFD